MCERGRPISFHKFISRQPLWKEEKDRKKKRGEMCVVFFHVEDKQEVGTDEDIYLKAAKVSLEVQLYELLLCI